jgi:hypothetical protein
MGLFGERLPKRGGGGRRRGGQLGLLLADAPQALREAGRYEIGKKRHFLRASLREGEKESGDLKRRGQR